MSLWRATEESGLRENCTGRLNERTEEGPHGPTSSDSTLKKHPNNKQLNLLEGVEGRPLTKGNTRQSPAVRTLSRGTASRGL